MPSKPKELLLSTRTRKVLDKFDRAAQDLGLVGEIASREEEELRCEMRYQKAKRAMVNLLLRLEEKCSQEPTPHPKSKGH